MHDQSTSSICYYNGQWHTGPVPIMNTESNAAWLANTVFDGSRAFEGVAPDLDLHCQRVIRSAQGLGLRPTRTWEEIHALALEGIARYTSETPLYIRPMFWAESGPIVPNADSTRFALVILSLPLSDPAKGFSASLSPYRRPGPEQAPTHCKASCLYPLAGLAVAEANRRGFDNALMGDPIGNVAEFTAQNVMIGKGGVCHTPAPNGTFLNGITRQRVIGLLRAAGVEVVERTIRPAEVLEADEIFSTGNHSKVLPCLRYEGRTLTPGPVYQRARTLYWEYAHSAGSAVAV